MDIDELFKVPKLPGNKRKMPDNPTPEMLKKLKMDSGAVPVPSSPNVQEQKQTNRVTMEEVDDEEDRNFAPSGDADYFAEEDEEGRFYGGGLTSEQKQILNIFDGASEQSAAEPPEMNITLIRRLLLNFERAVNKNQDQRSKYPDDPTRFIDSEADLDIAIKSLLPLSQVPVLAYPELVRSTGFGLLIGLLTHENMDIVIDAIELIHELMDEDPDADDTDEYEEFEEALKVLAEALVANSALELLVDNLSRLNEKEEADKQGTYHVLGIFENLIGFNPDNSLILVSKTKLMPWILKRTQGDQHDENRSYAAELLSILLQNSTEIRASLGENDGVESLLKSISQYRRRDPVDAEETEFMENIFDALCLALSETSVKKLFLEAEGLDLMILIMKEKKASKSRSIKVLDHALSGSSVDALCEAFVEVLGLKTLFTAFMGKAGALSNKPQKGGFVSTSEDVGHILGIISSLLSRLPPDSSSRVRLLTKFVENDYEKVDKLLEIRENARNRLKAAEPEIDQEQEDSMDDDNPTDISDRRYLKRLDAGLFTLQTVDYILAWLILEDDGIRNHALRLLDRANQSLTHIAETLRIFHEHADDTTDDSSSPSQKDILEGLLSALEETNTQ